jgi:hypothetical protein
LTFVAFDHLFPPNQIRWPEANHSSRPENNALLRLTSRLPQTSRFNQLWRRYQITTWKAQLEKGAADVFGCAASTGAKLPAVDVKSLHAKIGELTLENDFLEGALGKAGLLSARR